MAVKQGNKELILEIFKQQKSTSDSSLSTLENLLEKLVNPGEEFGFDEPILKVDDFKIIFDILGKRTTGELISKNYENITDTEVKLLSAILRQVGYYILDEDEI
jgi:hypothetical protein